MSPNGSGSSATQSATDIISKAEHDLVVTAMREEIRRLHDRKGRASSERRLATGQGSGSGQVGALLTSGPLQ